MAFTKKFNADPLRNRVYLLVHSDPKVGKTHMVLDLVRKHGDFVVLFSFDEGTFEVRQNPDAFEGKLAIAKPTSLKQLREDMEEGEKIVERLVHKGIPRWKIWTVIDTATHMQQRLMVEARQINVKNPQSGSSREFVRDAVTEVDFNVNLAHMTEVANWLATLRCNVIINALSREEQVNRNKTGRVVPAISGQSGLRFAGDADAILYLDKDKDEERFLSCALDEGGDRSGFLEKREPADLTHVMRKMLHRPLEKEVETLPAPAEAPKTDGAIIVAPKNDAPATETAEAPQTT